MLVVESRLRKQPSQARSRSTVEAFLEAADRVLRKEGYEAASTNRLAKVAGFSVGSLYQYFDDKQAVVGTLVDRELRQEARDLVRLLEGAPPRDLTSALHTIVDHLVGRRVDNAHLHATLAEHAQELGGERPLVYSMNIQAPLAGDAIQRVLGPMLVKTGAIEPRLTILQRWLHAVSHYFAVERPAHLSAGVLVQTLSGAASRFAGSQSAPSAEAMELASQWLRVDAASAPDGESRARRLQDVRSLVLRAAREDADGLEASVQVGAGVFSAFAWPGEALPCDGDQITRELAAALDAVIARGEATN